MKILMKMMYPPLVLLHFLLSDSHGRASDLYSGPEVLAKPDEVTVAMLVEKLRP